MIAAMAFPQAPATNAIYISVILHCSCELESTMLYTGQQPAIPQGWSAGTKASACGYAQHKVMPNDLNACIMYMQTRSLRGSCSGANLLWHHPGWPSWLGIHVHWWQCTEIEVYFKPTEGHAISPTTKHNRNRYKDDKEAYQYMYSLKKVLLPTTHAM